MREVWKWTVLCDEVRKMRSELLPSTINRYKNLLQTPSWKTIEHTSSLVTQRSKSSQCDLRSR